MASERTLELLAGREDPFPDFEEQMEAHRESFLESLPEKAREEMRRYERPSMHYDREGEPITMGQWALLFGMGVEYRRIAFTDLGLYHVSTVWLGTDLGFGFSPPMIFESMVFASEVSYSKEREAFVTESGIEFPAFPAFEFHEEKDCRRYSTEAQALAGHAELVTEVQLFQDALSGSDPRDVGA